MLKKAIYGIKRWVKYLVYGPKASSELYVSWLRKQGMSIGNNVTIYAPNKTIIDVTRPWLIKIGNDVQITEGVTILTHGFDWCVLKNVYGDVLGSSGKVTIGDNVFVGMHSTILKGVSIGNNVIIGAGSLITKDIPDNSVVAGNPARVIMDLDVYYEKRKANQYAECAELIREYIKTYNKNPDEKALHEFFWLFTDGGSQLPGLWNKVQNIGSNSKLTHIKFKNHIAIYKDLNDLIKSIDSKEQG